MHICCVRTYNQIVHHACLWRTDIWLNNLFIGKYYWMICRIIFSICGKWYSTLSVRHCRFQQISAKGRYSGCRRYNACAVTVSSPLVSAPGSCTVFKITHVRDLGEGTREDQTRSGHSCTLKVRMDFVHLPSTSMKVTLHIQTISGIVLLRLKEGSQFDFTTERT